MQLDNVKVDDSFLPTKLTSWLFSYCLYSFLTLPPVTFFPPLSHCTLVDNVTSGLLHQKCSTLACASLSSGLIPCSVTVHE